MNKTGATSQLLVRDVMTKKVVAADPETSIVKIAEVMFKNRFHGIPITENGQVVGIVTETDFFTKDKSILFLPSYINFLKENKIQQDLPKDKQAEVDRLINTKAKDIMNPDCVTIFQDMQIRDLLQFFRTTKFSSLPVTDENNRLVGIITLTDILGLLNT